MNSCGTLSHLPYSEETAVIPIDVSGRDAIVHAGDFREGLISEVALPPFERRPVRHENHKLPANPQRFESNENNFPELKLFF